MSIDWKKEAENRKDEMLADLKTMLEIESVRDESKGTPEAPLGPGPKEALDKFLEIGKRDGFETLELDGLAVFQSSGAMPIWEEQQLCPCRLPSKPEPD